jgi:hypothetical protein
LNEESKTMRHVLSPPPPPDDRRDRAAVGAWLTHFGGLTWRLDTPAVGLARLAGVLAAAPGLLLWQIAPLLLRYPARLDPRPWRSWFRGRARIEYLNIVSHHFMGRTELATGRERLALCVFKAPVGDRLVWMCELNALGLRDQYYEGLREADRRTHGGS